MHNRSIERAALKRKLSAGVSVHMPAPRRIGKTWTIGKLATDLRADGWIVVEVDVQGMSTPHQFAEDLCRRIEGQTVTTTRVAAHLKQAFENLLGGNWGHRPIDALTKLDPIKFTETLVATLNDGDMPTAIIIDEIAHFFLRLAEADVIQTKDFAYQLRAVQQRYTKVRWLITGSIGLDTIASRYKLSGAFVDFERFELPPFSKAEARSFLRDPALQNQLNRPFQAEDADLDAMFDDLGWLAPFYLKLLANEVRPSIQTETGAQRATRSDLLDTFDLLLRPNRKSEFAVWTEHIDKNLPKSDRPLAKSVLDRLSQFPDGETEATLLAHASQKRKSVTRKQLQDVLDMLVNDGFLIKAGDQFRFLSGFIRRYWREFEAG